MTQPTRHQIMQALKPYMRPNSPLALAIYGGDLIVYAAGIAGVLFLPELWMKLAASIVAGSKIPTLVALAHECAHGAFTKWRAVNKVLAIIGFTPGLFNYILWLQDHHRLHHPLTNGDHPDTYTPFSKAEYDALPRWRQALEKLYRSPFGFGFYYIFERWQFAKLYPHGFMPKIIHKAAWAHFAYLMVYLTAFVTFLALSPNFAPVSSLTAVTLGFALPFFLFQMFFCWVLYLQHTHPEVPWFRNRETLEGKLEQEDVSPHVVMPTWFSTLIHHALDHPVHHIAPRVPGYRVREAQRVLNGLLGDHAIVTPFTFAWFFKTMRVCRLYDYENHRWLDWDGTPTTGSTLKPHVAERLGVEIAPRRPTAEPVAA